VKTTLEWVAGYGPPVLFAWVMVDQAGIPLPAIPLLLAVGALVGAGKMNVLVALGTALAGCLAADLIWYGFGRRRGAPVLGSLCRITLEADTCVRRVEGLFTRYRLGTLFMAKFLPGLNPIAAALSGVVKVRIDRFIGIELAGALVWAAGWMSVGYAFSDLIDRVTDQVSRMGGLSILLIVGLLAAYVGVKYVQRQRFIRALRMARMTPEELKQRIEDGQETIIVDLRTPLDVQTTPFTIRGALRMSPEEIEKRHGEIPRDVDIVLCCS